jgi:phosphosulfolactate synthase
MISEARRSTSDFMRAIGVADLPPLTVVFDPGYDPATLEGHLEQSHPLMAALKISMACWIVAVEQVTRRKIALARACGVPVVTGGGPFEIAVAQRQLPAYLDLCAEVGVSRIECGEGFTDMPLPAREVPGWRGSAGSRSSSSSARSTAAPSRATSSTS